jgi:hypothetical protein
MSRRYVDYKLIIHTDSYYIANDASWIVLFERNPHFTGRESQLAKLREMLFVRGQTAKGTRLS